jgi:uncharacterized membrane protein YfcA
MEFAGYIALICIGMVLSLMGGGGSLLTVPILVYPFALDVVTASSYSLFVVGATSLLGAWLKQKDHRIDLRASIIFSTSSVAAIFLTRNWILPGIPDEIYYYDHHLITKRGLFLGVFALLAIASSVVILLKPSCKSRQSERQRSMYLIPVGFITGMLVGFVGVGGGFLILPALIIFGRLSFKIAVGTTLLVIGFNSLLGFLGDVMNHPINWLFLSIITALATLGMLLGNIYGKKIPIRHLRLSFGWIMLTISIAILVKEWVL